MAINITVGSTPEERKEKIQQVKTGTPDKKRTSPKFNLQVRKSIDGNLLIFTHEDLDIVIDQQKSKVVVYSTDMTRFDDKIYDSQDRYLRYLAKKGIIDPTSIRSGNVIGSLEAKILEPKENKVNRYDMALLVTAKWIEREKPGFMYQQEVKEDRVEELTEPEEKDTTDMGQIKHKSTNKGVGSTFGTKNYAGQSPGVEE